MLLWGRHEASRGASWLEFSADGSLIYRSYLPNHEGKTQEKRLGFRPKAEFLALEALIRDFARSDGACVSSPSDPAHVLTLEYIGPSTRQEWRFSADETGRNPALKKVADTFSRLEKVTSEQSILEEKIKSP